MRYFQGSSYTEPRISASAAGVRGLMIHLNGAGKLKMQINVKVSLQIYSCHNRSYDANPLVNSALSLIVLPWLSTGGLIS